MTSWSAPTSPTQTPGGGLICGAGSSCTEPGRAWPRTCSRSPSSGADDHQNRYFCLFSPSDVFLCKPYDEIISQEPCDPEWAKQQSSFHVPVSESAAIVQSVCLVDSKWEPTSHSKEKKSNWSALRKEKNPFQS